MKKIIFVLAVLMSYGLTLAQTPTYEEANGKDNSVNISARVIRPLTIENIYTEPDPLPAVVKGATRTFSPGTPTGMPGVDNPGSNGNFGNGSTGNYGWVFKLKKQPGTETNNQNADPYKVSLQLTLNEKSQNSPSNAQVKIDGKWYFYERDYITPKETLPHIFGQDINTTWFSDEEEALLAFYLTSINATGLGVTTGVKDFTISIKAYYSAI